MQIAFRPALDQDFAYCRRVYFAEMDWIIRELHLDEVAQAESFRQQWNPTQVRIITLNGADTDNDIGWLQSFPLDDEIFLSQLFVERAHQRCGIGTEVMNRLMKEAEQLNRAVRLDVVKINPARRLYERLGFRIVGEEERKFHMKRDPDRTSQSDT
jgi:ribosomal protein S18 acetylase RimI-like enzyme